MGLKSISEVGPTRVRLELMRQAFVQGWRSMLPLWLGVVPFGMAYAVTARAGGLNILETQALSVFVFAGGSQFSAAGMFASHTPGLTIILTTFLLNVRHALYGLSLGRHLRLSNLERFVGAYFLTDEAFGVMIASGQSSFGFLLGAELSLFFSWNLATLAGAYLGSSLSDPAALGVDFVFPLAFLALLVPIVRARIELIVAVFSGVLAWWLNAKLPAGLPILLTGVIGSLLGAWLTRHETPEAPDSAFNLEAAIREVA
jgi:4-azaleucine resistance transporter AzlC